MNLEPGRDLHNHTYLARLARAGLGGRRSDRSVYLGLALVPGLPHLGARDPIDSSRRS